MKQQFSDNLKAARINEGISQESLAKKLGYQAGDTISKFENGKQEPSIAILQNMAQILNVTIDDLINGNIVIDEKKARDLKLIPQIKFNKIIYDIDLPHCQLDYGKLALDYYDWQNDDEEEVFLKHLTDFSGAYHLDTSVINPTAEVKEKIRNLYYAAFDHGNGLIEAGLNLIRFYIVQDIIHQRNGQDSQYSIEVIGMLYGNAEIDILDSTDTIDDMIDSCFLEMIFFYQAIFKVYGLYIDSQNKEEVQEFINDGYRELIKLANHDYNPYAIEFLKSINEAANNVLRKKVETIVSKVNLEDDLSQLSDEDKAWLEYIQEIEKDFDEIEKWIYEDAEKG